MAKNLYVGNMSFSTTEDQLRELFSQYGTVTKVQLIMDRETGRPRGFAFVEMSDGGEQAIAATNGMQLDGRTLTVNEAKPREDRPRGGGGGGYGGGWWWRPRWLRRWWRWRWWIWRWRRRPSLLVQPEVFLQPRRESPGLFRSMAADFRLSCGSGR